MRNSVLILSLFFFALILLSSCSREKTSFNDNHSEIYGKWILQGGSGGFSGASFDPSFDYMIVDGNEKFTIYKDGDVISRGKINIIEQTVNNLKVSFNKRSGEDCLGYFNKKISFISGELYISDADISDGSSLHFIKADSYSNDDYARDSKQIEGLQVNKYDLGFHQRNNCLCFIDENIGFIGCNDGSILKTVNAGVTWTEIRVADDIPIYDVFFINESIGFAGGGQTHNSTTSALLLKTFDGGNTWVQKHVNTNISDIRKITFFNDNDGLVIGKSTKSITHDAGMSWEEVDAQIDGDLLGFFVLYENTAFVFTTWSDKLWKSTDKGETWEEIWMQESVYMKSIQFISEDIGFLGMQDIYKTDDGGYTWTIFEDAFSDINDLYFQDENNGVVFGTRFYIYNGDAAWKTDFNVLTNGVWNGDERVRDIELSCRIDHQTFYAINNLDEFIVIKLPT